jgi:hypothetical protein
LQILAIDPLHKNIAGRTFIKRQAGFKHRGITGCLPVTQDKSCEGSKKIPGALSIVRRTSFTEALDGIDQADVMKDR